MASSPTKKQETRKRILDAASQGFRRSGYAGIGVDGIAKAAGVTSGAFYAHFGSKDNTFRAALEFGLDEVIEALPKFQNESGEEWVKDFVDYYIGKAHRKDLACGCAMTTLSPEVVRADPKIHSVYETRMKKIVNLLADGLEGSSRDECISRAWGLLAVLTGGLTMARAVKTSKSAEEIAASICIVAISVAGNTKKP
ncbi:Transcriptional regulator, AcrR family [hydrothermal vent metagenome]|uniref:Transcriptional regulator, AcrR family n=1 Tax=hydrothermal vent metagenome TaxID=652676 RepID=A0A3B0XHY9_9ZZZZ